MRPLQTADEASAACSSSSLSEGMTIMVNDMYAGCALLLLVFSGCATSSEVDESPLIHEVQIRGQGEIAPLELYAYVGEEIRWRNLVDTPVRLGFLSTKLMDELGCEKGFKTLLGGINDLVTIDPGEYVSLCFGRAGTIRYNVWTDIADPVHSMSPTAVIHFDEAT